MNVLIFGGASEGRKLSSVMTKAGINVVLSVATEYGRSAAANTETAVLAGRLDEREMTELLIQGGFDCVIDATHPYAVMAARNIQAACQAAGVKRYRLKRPESAGVPGVSYVPDVAAAAEMTRKSDGKVLLTIGSKELEPFTFAENYAERFFVRIPPMPDSLKKALDLGFRGSHIICMQGPCDMEMNMATLKMTGAECLVTKESGDAGGFGAKVSAAMSLGCGVIVVSRPVREEGYTFDELLGVFDIREAPERAAGQSTLFPLFIDIRGKKIIVIGGGNIAERRIKILASFGADITVISPGAAGYIKTMSSQGAVHLIERAFQSGDITHLKPVLVIAATDDRQVNHAAMMEASGLNIHVSVADCREECTCYFPAVAESEGYIAGLVSKNGDHAGVKKTAEKIRRLLNT